MGASKSQDVLTILCLIVQFLACNNEFIRCVSEEGCPSGGHCFKDECARCLCPENSRVVNLYTDGQLIKICQKKRNRFVKVGEECTRRRAKCPKNSYCNDVTKTCTCKYGYSAHDDNSYCRRPIYGERCDNKEKICEEALGLICDISRRTCKCHPAYHRPYPWTNFVLNRWDYSKFSGEPQVCIARAVGEPCQNNVECGAVKGSGAICNPCGFCECSVSGHVPDILGTKCGPSLGFNEECTINSHSVCDGEQGLQCGDICDLYSYDFNKKECKCSQMHDYIGGECVRKSVGSYCSTDLDCYPLDSGYGFCSNGWCDANTTSPASDYEPYLINRKCLADMYSTTTGTLNAKKELEPGGKNYSKYIHDGKGSKSVKLNSNNYDLVATTITPNRKPYFASSTATSVESLTTCVQMGVFLNVLCVTILRNILGDDT